MRGEFPHRYRKNVTTGVKQSAGREILFALLLLRFATLASFCSPSPKPFPFLFENAKRSVFRLEYGGESLSDRTRYDLNRLIPATDNEELLFHSRPRIEKVNGKLCIYSHPPFYFQNEAGLRFVFCVDETAFASRSVQDGIERIYRSSLATALPRIETGTLAFSVESPAQIRKRIQRIDVSVDGSEDDLLRREKLEGGIQFRYARANLQSGATEYPLPRRFANAPVFLLLGEGGLFILYPFFSDTRFFVIELHDTALVRSVQTGLRRLRSVIERQFKEAARNQNDAIAVTEIVFADQGSAGNEWIELSSAVAVSQLVSIELVHDGGTIRTERFLFPHASLLFSRTSDPQLRFQNGITAGSAAQPKRYAYGDYRTRGGSRYRTLSAEAALRLNRSTGSAFDLFGSLRCFAETICGSPGIHPDFLESLPLRANRANQTDRECTNGDFQLTEFNPFGIRESDGRLLPSGKFVELSVASGCRSDHHIVLAGESVLDPVSIDSTTPVLLFVGNGSFFGPNRPHINSTLLRLTPHDPVTLLDLATGATSVLRPSHPPTDLYLYGYRSSPASPLPIHSLVYERGVEMYHEEGGSGLRPDIEGDNHMSPGFANPSPLMRSGVRISELLSHGSNDPLGNRINGDEFIEFESTASRIDSLAILEIRRHSDQKVFRFRLYLPPGLFRFALMSGSPVCFEQNGAIESNGTLYLPNSAATYTVYDATGNRLDEVTVSAELDSLLSTAVQKSLQRIPATALFRIADGAASTQNLCTGGVVASPGLPNDFLPFFEPTAEGIGSRTFRFHAPVPTPETVRIDIGRSLLSPLFSYNSVVTDQTELQIAPVSPGNRLLISFQPLTTPGAPLQVEELFLIKKGLQFQSLAATPIAPAVEWIRLCSPDGFGAADAPFGLFIEDRFASDQIVPYLNRFAAMPQGVALRGDTLSLQAGECALLVDPDYSPLNQILPVQPNDTALWTIASTAAIGNGLASGEGVAIYRIESDLSKSPLCSLGLPDTPVPFSIPTLSGERMERIGSSPYDQFLNYGVLR